MADFVGLLKRTIETQSQVTPLLRQRIYERAMTTVERKLVESNAPAPLVERQREILQRAIDEVEAYYQQLDAQADVQPPQQEEEKYTHPTTEPAPQLEEAASEQGETIRQISVPENDLPHSQQTSLAPGMAAPPSFVQALENEPEASPHFVAPLETLSGAQEPPLPIQNADAPQKKNVKASPLKSAISDVSVQVDSAPNSDAAHLPSYPPFGNDSLAELVQPPADVLQKNEDLKKNIPSLATLLQVDNTSAPAPVKDFPKAVESFTDRTAGENNEVELPSELVDSPLPPPPLPEAEPQAARGSDLPFPLDEKEPHYLPVPDSVLPAPSATARPKIKIIGITSTPSSEPPQQNSTKVSAAPASVASTANLSQISHPAQNPSDSDDDNELLAQLPIDTPLPPPIKAKDATVPPASVKATDRPLPMSPLGDYLPHWTEDNPDEKFSPFDAPLGQPREESLSFESFLGTLPEFVPVSSSVRTHERAESEIEKARREIEALRSNSSLDDTHENIVDDLPFFPEQDPHLPPPSSAASQLSNAENLINVSKDPVSEIFIQAAKREQRKSSKNRRLAAIIIATVVVAILSAIVGVLVLANGQWFLNQPGDSEQIDGQASSSNGATDEAVIADQTADLNPKITRQLLPDGQEADPGVAREAPTPGEGSSQTNATLPAIDNSAKAVFYEAPTDTTSSTANDGRVEWSLQRTTPPIQSSDQNAQDLPQALTIVGNVTIPALDMILRLKVSHNSDESIPADYLIEIIFALPDDFEGEAIDKIGPILFKASEQSAGQELIGMSDVKIQDNLFLLVVRAPQPIMERNLALMRQLPWLKLNVLYKNGQVGEFSIAKGEGGDRIFKQVIDEWTKQSNIVSGQGERGGISSDNIANEASQLPATPTQDESPLSSPQSEGGEAQAAPFNDAADLPSSSSANPAN